MGTHPIFESDFDCLTDMAPVRIPDIARLGSSGIRHRLALWQGDLTKLEIDAIVNAANKTLLGGGGVDGAIHRGAGPNLLKACRTLKGRNTGQVKMTGGFKLPAKNIIHTVGPQGEKPLLLEDCYRNALALADKEQFESIAFPCISTGVYGYPSDNAARVAVQTVVDFLNNTDTSLKLIIFCVFLDKDLAIYEDILEQLVHDDEENFEK